MPPRSRASLVERPSWKDAKKTATPTLVYWRRGIATVVSAALLVLFGIAIWYMLGGDPGWIARSASIDDYDLTTPPVLFAQADSAALQGTSFWQTTKKPRHEKVIKTLVDQLKQEAKQTAAGGPLGKKEPDLLVYVSAHGVSHGDEAFLLESDFDISVRSERKINLNELLKAVQEHPAPLKLLVIDSGPLERDLHQGIAVNRFPELLQAAVSTPQSDAKQGELWVLASHGPLERSHVEPSVGRSLFSYFFTEALAASETNADVLGPDGGDGYVSLLDLSLFVHHQVAGHVWDASGRTRTQTPVLIKAGAGPVDLDSTTTGEAYAALDKIIVARVPVKRAADKADAAAPPEKGATDNSKKTSRTSPRLPSPFSAAPSPFQRPVMAWAHYQQAGAAPDSAVEKTGAEAPAAAKAGETPATDAKDKPSAAAPVAEKTADGEKAKPAPPKAAASSPPASKLPKLPPRLAQLNGVASALAQQWRQPQSPSEWRALDFAPQYWRAIRDNQLGHQRRVLSAELSAPPPAAPGAPPPSSASISQNSLISLDEVNAVQGLGAILRTPASDSAFAQAEFREAIQLRDEVFAVLPYWIDLQDRLVDDSAELWKGRMGDLLDALQALCDTLERPAATDSRGATTSELKIFDERPQSGQHICDLRELAEGFVVLQEARDQAALSLQKIMELGGTELKVPPNVARLQRWEIAQAIPLSGEDLGQSWSHLSAGAPAKPQASRDRRAPTIADADNVRQALFARRLDWLRLQQRLAAFLDVSLTGQDSELSAAIDRVDSLAATTEVRAADANKVCDQIRATYPEQFSPLSVEASVPQCWQSDRTLRIVPWSLADRRTLEPVNQPLAVLQVPFRSLDPILVLDGPHSGGQETLSAPIALDLQKPIELHWQLSGSGLKRLLPGLELRIVYDDDMLLVTDVDGRPVRKNAVRVDDAGSLIDKQGRIAVRVKAKQEVNFAAGSSASGALPTVEGKSQAALRLEVKVEISKQLSSATLFRIPEPGWLAVFVEGQPGTIGQGDTLAPDKAPLSFHPSPDRDWLRYPVATPDGCSHIHLSPFPQGATEYRLGVINRASKPRTVVCRFFVAPPGDPTQQVASDRATISRLTTRAPRFVSAPTAWNQGAEIVLQVPPAAAPPAAAAPPPAAPPSDAGLDLSNGAVYEIQDVNDKTWTQLIWITARPQNPDKYLQANAQFNFETKQIKVTFTAPSKERLPVGESKVEWDRELKDIRTSTAEMTGNLFSGVQQFSILAQPSEDAAGLDEFRAILHCDGYPRAFHFNVPRDGTPVPSIRDGRLKYLDLRVEMEAGDGKEPKWVRVNASNAFFQKPPKLRFELAADVPPAIAAQEDGYLFAVYVNSPRNIETPFYHERQFQVGLQKSMDQPLNFALVSSVDNLRGTIVLPEPKTSQKFSILGRIDRRQPGSGKSLIVSEPVAIVIDNEPPRVVIDTDVFFKDQPTIRDRLIIKFNAPGAYVPFRVTDDSVSDREAISGVDPQDIQWSLAIDARGDLVDAKPVEGVQRGRASLLLAGDVLKPGRNTIYLRARDRAGNWSDVTSARIEKLPEVKAPAKAG